MTEFTRKVFEVVRSIPRGRVLAYGDVAALVGTPRAARGVGRVLSSLGPEAPADEVPWWRVVNRRGEISIRNPSLGAPLQRALLEAEGVTFNPLGRVDLDRYGWSDPSPPR